MLCHHVHPCTAGQSIDRAASMQPGRRGRSRFLNGPNRFQENVPGADRLKVDRITWLVWATRAWLRANKRRKARAKESAERSGRLVAATQQATLERGVTHTPKAHGSARGGRGGRPHDDDDTMRSSSHSNLSSKGGDRSRRRSVGGVCVCACQWSFRAGWLSSPKLCQRRAAAFFTQGAGVPSRSPLTTYGTPSPSHRSSPLLSTPQQKPTNQPTNQPTN